MPRIASMEDGGTSEKTDDKNKLMLALIKKMFYLKSLNDQRKYFLFSSLKYIPLRKNVDVFFLFYVRFVSGVRRYKILTFFLLDEDKLDMIFIYDVAILRNATQKHLTEVKRRMLLCTGCFCAVLCRVESVSC